jgi:predicted HTH domain antitoxin
MQTVTISIADAILSSVNMDKDEMAQAMCVELALKLFREGKLSLEQSAELCKMNIYDFLSVLSRAGVPVINYEPEELEKEIAGFSNL